MIKVNNVWQDLSTDAQHSMIFLAIGLCLMFIIMVICGTGLLAVNLIREVFFLIL